MMIFVLNQMIRILIFDLGQKGANIAAESQKIMRKDQLVVYFIFDSSLLVLKSQSIIMQNRC